jgi:guanine nucleotide-binding protein G(i) subunit alpha
MYYFLCQDGDGVYVLTTKLASYIAMLWKDPGIQQTYRHRALFQLNDSAKYFFDQVEDLAVTGYIPTEDHMLRARVRTTGVSETLFKIDKTQFRMVDVGGQRSERKKWIRCFENVTCVLFVAAISTYDQSLFEDDGTNRIIEALNLFEETCNSQWFEKTSIILFLNKRDLFLEKLAAGIPITECAALSGYEGKDDDYQASVDYIRDVFLECNKTTKTIYPHVTCATDRNNVNVVFQGVKDTVLKENLKMAGLTV